VARIEAASCDGCNRCAARCPFDAIIRSAGPTKGELVVPAIDTALCRGCGVCATGCHSTAIVMDPV
jgi:Pyruvate/2-oxoacid:ferredoxin oxidoreductase delta subunit